MSHAVDPSRLDLIARISRSNSWRETRISERSPHYTTTASPSAKPPASPLVKPTDSPFSKTQGCVAPTEDVEAGKPDEPVTPKIQLTDPRWAGLVMHCLAIGAVPTVLELSQYPFLAAYLNMEGTQTLSARTLMIIPWCLRPIFRILMDSIPLFKGQHHRMYLIMGWLLTSLSLGAMFFIDFPDPYYGDLTLVGHPYENMTPQQLSTVNFEAPPAGAIYVMFMAFATVGCVFADVAADVLMETMAHQYFPTPSTEKESPFITRMTWFRYGTMLLSYLYVGICLNGWSYSGYFNWTLDFNELMLITGIFASLPIPFAWFLIEDVAWERKSLSGSCWQLWGLFQNGTAAYVIACRFLGGICSGISATPVNPIAYYWIGVQPFGENIFNFASIIVIVILMGIVEHKGWTLNYRLLIIGVNLVILLLDCGATYFTIWNVARSQWLWIGLPILETLPSGLDHVLLTVILGEICDSGSEELMRSLIVAVSFLSTTCAHTVTKYIDARFSVWNDDIADDTYDVRVQTSVVFAIAYVSQLLSMVWVFTLPRNREQAREWKRKSLPSPRAGSFLMLVLFLTLVWCIVMNMLSVMDATTCLWIAGGDGCWAFW